MITLDGKDPKGRPPFGLLPAVTAHGLNVKFRKFNLRNSTQRIMDFPGVSPYVCFVDSGGYPPISLENSQIQLE